MNLQKAKILLEKINRLYKSMSLDEENVAAIEKDLMRDYIKQLYDTFMQEDMVDIPVKKGSPAPKKTYSPPPVVRKHIEVTPPPPPKIVEEIAPAIEEEEPAPAAVKIEETPVRQPFKPAVAPPRLTRKPPPKINLKHEELFTQEIESNELSQKLSLTPIKNLNKAMGLNERIFTINELFGGDNGAFKTVMNDLNKLATFEEAKIYLSQNVADKYDWASKTKRNKAKNFIKLIRRRYI